MSVQQGEAFAEAMAASAALGAALARFENALDQLRDTEPQGGDDHN